MGISSSEVGKKEQVKVFLVAALVTSAATDGSFDVCIDTPTVNEGTLRPGTRPNNTSENISRATTARTVPEKKITLVELVQ